MKPFVVADVVDEGIVEIPGFVLAVVLSENIESSLIFISDSYEDGSFSNCVNSGTLKQLTS